MVARTGRPVTAGREAAWTGVAIEGLTLGLGAFKTAEDGGRLVFRAWEPAGARGRVDVALPDGWRLGDDLDLLEQAAGPAERSFLPFQLRSWSLVRD